MVNSINKNRISDATPANEPEDAGHTSSADRCSDRVAKTLGALRLATKAFGYSTERIGVASAVVSDKQAVDACLFLHNGVQPRFDNAVEQQRHRQQSGHSVHFGLDAQEVTVAECHRHADSVQEAIAGEGFLERLAEHHGEQCCKKDGKCSLPALYSEARRTVLQERRQMFVTSRHCTVKLGEQCCKKDGKCSLPVGVWLGRSRHAAATQGTARRRSSGVSSNVRYRTDETRQLLLELGHSSSSASVISTMVHL
ncbi:hypothetical protein LSAT2_018819 [Lamellibrachia satsuma]|nr:hypothetical protein LSAT2_018819 [Lamellibrachia satsuma]